MAAAALLNWRALGVTKGTVDTTIPGKRTQNLATSIAVIEELTGIGRHLLLFRMAAVGARDC